MRSNEEIATEALDKFAAWSNEFISFDIGAVARAVVAALGSEGRLSTEPAKYASKCDAEPTTQSCARCGKVTGAIQAIAVPDGEGGPYCSARCADDASKPAPEPTTAQMIEQLGPSWVMHRLSSNELGVQLTCPDATGTWRTHSSESVDVALRAALDAQEAK